MGPRGQKGMPGINGRPGVPGFRGDVGQRGHIGLQGMEGTSDEVEQFRIRLITKGSSLHGEPVTAIIKNFVKISLGPNIYVFI